MCKTLINTKTNNALSALERKKKLLIAQRNISRQNQSIRQLSSLNSSESAGIIWSWWVKRDAALHYKHPNGIYTEHWTKIQTNLNLKSGGQIKGSELHFLMKRGELIFLFACIETREPRLRSLDVKNNGWSTFIKKTSLVMNPYSL